MQEVDSTRAHDAISSGAKFGSNVWNLGRLSELQWTRIKRHQTKMANFRVEEILGDEVISVNFVVAPSPRQAAEMATRLFIQPRTPGRFFVRVTEEDTEVEHEFSFSGLPY